MCVPCSSRSSFTSRRHTSSIGVDLYDHTGFPIYPFIGLLVKVGTSVSETAQDTDLVTVNNYRVLPYEFPITFPGILFFQRGTEANVVVIRVKIWQPDITTEKCPLGIFAGPS